MKSDDELISRRTIIVVIVFLLFLGVISATGLGIYAQYSSH